MWEAKIISCLCNVCSPVVTRKLQKHKEIHLDSFVNWRLDHGGVFPPDACKFLFWKNCNTHALMSSQLDPGALLPRRPLHHGQESFPGAALRHKRRADHDVVFMLSEKGAEGSLLFLSEVVNAQYLPVLHFSIWLIVFRVRSLSQRALCKSEVTSLTS